MLKKYINTVKMLYLIKNQENDFLLNDVLLKNVLGFNKKQLNFQEDLVKL